MRDPSFAPPASKLADSGIPNTVSPTGGMGLTLDHLGRVPLQAFSAIPRVRVYNSAAVVRASGAGTAVGWDSERYDSEDIHDTATNNSRLTCRTAGIYDIFVHGDWSANPVNAYLVFLVNSNAIAHGQVVADWRSPSLSLPWALAVSDYVEVVFDQFSGGNLNLNAGAGFGMTWIGPLVV